MNKQQLLEQLDREWSAFNQSWAGLGSNQLVEPGVMEDWSVRDLVAHVSWWEEEALKFLPLVLDGKKPPRYKDLYGGIDAFNAQMTELKRDLSLEEVLEQAQEIHHQLVAYVKGAPEEQFSRETRFRRRLRLDTYGHYPIHTHAIQEWRRRLSS